MLLLLSFPLIGTSGMVPNFCLEMSEDECRRNTGGAGSRFWGRGEKEDRVRWAGLQMGRAENGRGQTWAQSKQVIQSHSSASLLQHRNLQEGESQASSRGRHPAVGNTQ